MVARQSGLYLYGFWIERERVLERVDRLGKDLR